MKSSWLESKTMFTLFSCSAWVVVCWGVFIVFDLIVRGQQSFKTTNLIGVVSGSVILVVSSVAFLIIIFGMAIHCLFGGFSIGAKILWSVFAFLTMPFGPAIYFFAVYKKLTKIQREVTDA